MANPLFFIQLQLAKLTPE